MRDEAQVYFKELQNRITNAFSGMDGTHFREDMWSREGGGGGSTRVMEGGNLFEKCGVNFSEVQGKLPEKIADEIPVGSGTEFFATGISLVIHPLNPKVPIVHANLRYLEKGNGSWFGGGADLTPCYPNLEDGTHFHGTLKAACDAHDPNYYPRFKQWCDDYFTIRHRGEMRGIGGIFFDYLQKDMNHVFEFIQTVGNSLLPAYLPIVERRKDESFGDRERKFQMLRRGRYAEFNLVYDRGTVFGLNTQGRTESILMSLPPVASWIYDFKPEPGTAEAEASAFFQPRDWV